MLKNVWTSVLVSINDQLLIDNSVQPLVNGSAGFLSSSCHSISVSRRMYGFCCKQLLTCSKTPFIVKCCGKWVLSNQNNTDICLREIRVVLLLKTFQDVLSAKLCKLIVMKLNWHTFYESAFVDFHCFESIQQNHCHSKWKMLSASFHINL